MPRSSALRTIVGVKPSLNILCHTCTVVPAAGDLEGTGGPGAADGALDLQGRRPSQTNARPSGHSSAVYRKCCGEIRRRMTSIGDREHVAKASCAAGSNALAEERIRRRRPVSGRGHPYYHRYQHSISHQEGVAPGTALKIECIFQCH